MMKNELIRSLLVIVFCALLCGTASAQQAKVEGLNFKLGDNVDTVKTALQTTSDPEPLRYDTSIPNHPNKGKTLINLQTRGIQVVFSKNGILENIRLSTPYEGTVAGIKIGDPETKVRSVRGKPLRTPWNFGENMAFLYALDDTARVRFDINDTDGVQTIWILK